MFPGKLVSGHIMDLIQAGVDRIFYPMVFYERNEFEDANNSFQLPGGFRVSGCYQQRD